MNPIKLVIVDDYRLDLDMLERAFSKNPGIQITALFNNAIALFDALQTPYFSASFDLLLLDINMPVMSGMEALELLMKQPHPFRIMMISHGFNKQNKVLINNLGCPHYCSKDPMNLQQLIPQIHAGELGFEYHYTQLQWKERTTKENLLLKDAFYWTNLLSYREIELIKVVATGLNNKQLANHFKCGTTIIKQKKKGILIKLGLIDKASLIAWAKREGLG